MFGAVIGLMLLGGAFVLSAAIDQYEDVPLLNSYFFRQLVFYGVGFGLAAVFVVVDYHRLAGWARAAYWVTLILLVFGADSGHWRGAVRGEALARLGDNPHSTLGICKISVYLRLGRFFDTAQRGDVDAGGVLKIPRNDCTTIYSYIKRAGFGLIAGIFSNWDRDDVRCRRAASVSREVPRGIDGGCAVCHHQRTLLSRRMANLPAGISAPTVVGLFSPGFCSVERHPAERKAARALQRERTHNIRQAEISVGSGGLTGKGWGQGPQPAWAICPRAWLTTTSSSP